MSQSTKAKSSTKAGLESKSLSPTHTGIDAMNQTYTVAAATEIRPWGSFTTLEEGSGYKIKRIEVNPGHRLSLQMHHHRSEHWIVVSGTAKVTCDDQEMILSSNQSTYVPQCTSHRLENPGVIKLVLIEVQNGQYLGEDDIIRFSDDYARK